MDCSLPGSSIHGIFQARVLKCVAISFSRGSSRPRDWTQVSHITGRRFYIWAIREALALSKQPRNVTHSYCLVHLNLGSVQSLCHVRFVATPWTAAHQASLSITNSQSLFKLMSIKLVMSSNHLVLCHPFLSYLQSFSALGSFLMSQLFTSWPKYWRFSFKISPSNEYWGLISFSIDWFDLLEVQGTL